MNLESIVEVNGLTKTYGHLRALDNVSFTLKRGHIYGFIGENGAGKTTCIRVLAGLTLPDLGDVRVLDHPYPLEAPAARAKTGFMVEQPIFHDGLTAEDNLKQQMKLYGHKDYARIPDLLKRVGLTDIGKRKLKDFSLGMKQRLGIAMTLVNDPELLILDEPVNGLDPVGMVDVRNILRDLNREGITIFLSSHILSELYQLATDYIIIHHGRIIRQMTLAELDLACTKKLNIRTPQADRLITALKQRFPQADIVRENDQIVYVTGSEVTTKDIGQLVLDENILLTGLAVEGDNLESFYIKTIGGGHHA
mgnify:CR=1 FL=1